MGGLKTTVFRMSSPERALEARARVGAFAEINGGRAHQTDNGEADARPLLAIYHDEVDEADIVNGVLTIDPQATVMKLPGEDHVSPEMRPGMTNRPRSPNRLDEGPRVA